PRHVGTSKRRQTTWFVRLLRYG
ncbi:alkaline phosphatase family protein, partial [Vibrio parahaemolyticus V-223/04]